MKTKPASLIVTRVPVHYEFQLQKELCLITVIHLLQFYMHMSWASKLDEKWNTANVIDWEDLTP